MVIDIDSRKKKILKAVVQSYILTGKPVGSRTVDDLCDLGVSTATIRNELSALERMGFLDQPHTSAGRVPTDLGYRIYVDILMGHPRPGYRDVKAVQRLLNARTQEIERLFQEASMLLSRLTRTTAMVFAPFTPADTVRRLDLVKMSGDRVMVIVVTARGQVGHRQVSTGEPVSQDTVERVMRYLDTSLSGRDLDSVNIKSVLSKARFGRKGSSLLEGVLEAIREYLGTMDERVFIGGTANIVREIDHAGQEWVQSLLEAMEKQYLIIDLLKELIGEDRLMVRIGGENRVWELQRCAFVGTSYTVGEGLLGSLGVLGPTSMDYARTIGMVEYMAENLGRRLLYPGE